MEAERETEGCKRRDRTLSSLTEGKRETHSLAHCHMAIPWLTLLTATCAARPVRVCGRTAMSAQSGRTVLKLQRKLGGRVAGASEREGQEHMSTRLLPSVRPRSMYGRHMWPLDRVSGNAISVFRKPEIAELIHPSSRGWVRCAPGREGRELGDGWLSRPIPTSAPRSQCSFDPRTCGSRSRPVQKLAPLLHITEY